MKVAGLSRCDYGYFYNCLFVNKARNCVALSSTTFTNGKCPFYKNRDTMKVEDVEKYTSGSWRRREIKGDDKNRNE
jgi:hypothetical protein